MPAPIHLRPATLDDLGLLRHWDAQPHVIASDPSDDWQWEHELPRQVDWRQQLVAELAGRPVGFVQIIDPALEEHHYWGDCGPNLRAIDIWIGEAEDLGQGHGTRIMTQAIERSFATPQVRAILIDPLASNVRARRFYERMGFVFVEQRRFGDDDCAVYRLERGAWVARQALLSRSGGLWVFNKPAGIATHPGDRRVPDLVSLARAELAAPGDLSPLHRLDKGTSGILLMASDAALRGELGRQFAEGQVQKRYLALVQGGTHSKGVIRRPLADARRGRALPAVTRYRALERLGGFTLLQARPETGRKHQIRRHLQMIGRSIVGDREYRSGKPMRVPGFPGRLWLHALGVTLPDGRSFEAPLPPELLTHLQLLGSRRFGALGAGEEGRRRGHIAGGDGAEGRAGEVELQGDLDHPEGASAEHLRLPVRG